jgi:hypothetical protein
VLLGLAAPIFARGDDTPQPVPANGRCSVPSDPAWTPQEIFVWQRVCVGQVADFNEGPNYGGPLDPKGPKTLPEGRILRPMFLETILVEDKYRKVLTRRGVIISGARFTDNLDLRYAQLGHEFALTESLLEKGVDFSGLRSPYGVSLAHSNITGWFVMKEGHLGGQLSLVGTKITGGLGMIGGQVGGQLGLGGAMVTGPLHLEELQIGESLFMDRAQFGTASLVRIPAVSLVDVHIGGQLNLTGSKVTGKVLIQGIQIYSTAHLSRDAKFDGRVSFIYSKVGQNVELAGGSFHDNVNFSGTQIDGELRIGISDYRGLARWSPNSTLILRNTTVEAIQDLPNSWPDNLDLNGFTYHYLGGLSGPDRDPMINRSAEWFKDWLGKQCSDWLRKQCSYSPAPYQQLASVLREQGRPDTADEVLYAGKQRERARSSFPSSIGLTLSWLFIGYGYYKFNSAYWAFGLLIAGALLLWLSGEGWRISRHYKGPWWGYPPHGRLGLIYGLFYSFDLLLPIIRLRDKHYQTDLNGWVRYYFYFHKIMGYLLASFLIAGIAGLTK